MTIKVLNASFDFMKRYIVFGGGSLLGACIDYVGTLALNDALAIAPWVALGLVMFLSATVVFAYHERVTFRMAGEGWHWRYCRFLLLAIGIFLLRAGVLNFLVSQNLSVSLAVAVAILLISVVNFVASSAFIFLKGGK